MLKEKRLFLEFLKDGKQLYTRIHAHIKKQTGTSAFPVRQELLNDGYIEEDGFSTRSDGRKISYYRLTKKKFVSKDQSEPFWEDGTAKSRGNAFDWQNFSQGIYSQGEIAAMENGRKWGVMSASKKILPRTSI